MAELKDGELTHDVNKTTDLSRVRVMAIKSKCSNPILQGHIFIALTLATVKNEQPKLTDGMRKHLDECKDCSSSVPDILARAQGLKKMARSFQIVTAEDAGDKRIVRRDGRKGSLYFQRITGDDHEILVFKEVTGYTHDPVEGTLKTLHDWNLE